MRVGAVDVGSYSVRLSVADLTEEGLKLLREEGVITSLGSGVKETGRLREDRVEETLRVLKEFKRRAEELGARKVRAVATEAVRRAKNAEDFLKRVKEEVGLELEVLSPEEEGKLAYLGAVFSLKPEGKVCTVDQGGGSTELVVGEGMKAERVISLPIGIVNLTEGFLKGDPPSAEEVKSLEEFLEEKFKGLDLEAEELVGLGGTITTLAALEYGVYPYRGEEVHGKRLSLNALKRWFERLVGLPSAERSRLYPQIEDRRARVIPAGILAFIKLTEALGKEELVVSDWGLREGLLVEEWLSTFGLGR